MKILLVSFFISKNIGDLLIGKTLKEKIEQCGNEVIMYDFLQVKKIEEINEVVEYSGLLTESKKSNIVLRKVLGAQGQLLKYRCSNKWKKKFEQFAEDLEQCDEVYFGGGNMIMDITPVWSLILQDYVCQIKKHNLNYSFVAVGVGPIIHNFSKHIFRKVLLGAEKISVRGQASGTVLEKIGINEYQLTVDPVLTLDLKKEEIRQKRIQDYQITGKIDIGIGVLGRACFLSEKDYQVYILGTKDMIDTLYSDKRIDKIVLFTTEAMDYETMKYLESKNISKIVCGKSANTIIELYDNVDYIISGRMHSLILAQRCMVPFLAICWQEKVKEFCNIVEAEQDVISIYNIKNINMSSLRADEKISADYLNRTIEKNKRLKEIKQV